MLSCAWGRTERSPSLRTPSLPGTVTPLLTLSSLLSFLLSSMSLFLSCTFIIVILLVINRPAHLCNGSADTVESSSLYHTQAVYQDLVMINILTSKFDFKLQTPFVNHHQFGPIQTNETSNCMQRIIPISKRLLPSPLVLLCPGHGHRICSSSDETRVKKCDVMLQIFYKLLLNCPEYPKSVTCSVTTLKVLYKVS